MARFVGLGKAAVNRTWEKNSRHKFAGEKRKERSGSILYIVDTCTPYKVTYCSMLLRGEKHVGKYL